MSNTSTARTKLNALERVQHLYIAQLKLLDLLESDLRDPRVRQEVRMSMKEFETLLAGADWRYMGGLDVWETLQQLPEQMRKKLKESSSSLSRVKKQKSSRLKVSARSTVAKKRKK